MALAHTPIVIGIDANEANVAQRVGSNVYAFEILWALYRWLERTQRFSVRVFVAAPPLTDMPPAREGWEYVHIPQAPLWTLWKLPLALVQHSDLSLFFSPGHYVPSVTTMPVVASIMDLAYELFPEQFRTKDRRQLQWLTWWSARRARHLFAISEATQRDVIRHYGRTARDITVAYPAAHVEKPSVEEQTKVVKKFLVRKPYILYVGTLQPRKNLERLIDAFEVLRKQGYEGELVIAGKIGWQSEGIVQRIATSTYKSAIRQIGFVTDEEKWALMAQADMLVLVGLYEGFGMPPLEAMQLGTPVVVSHSSSLPEVVGEAGVQVDPESPDSIAEGMQHVLRLTRPEKQHMVKLLQQHATQFSWDKSGAIVGEKLWELATGGNSL